MPPGKTVGDKLTDETAIGFTVSIAVFWAPIKAAEIVTFVTPATFVVGISKFAEVAPAGTITLAGTIAAAAELLKATTAPLEGAGTLRYTAPRAAEPPGTEAGRSVSEYNASGRIVNVVD